MADKYGYSKSKNSKHLKKDQSSKKGCHKRDTMHSGAECKTPPLPTRKTSIEELLHKRESLKKELKKFEKHSETDLDTKHIHSKSAYSEMTSRKRKHRNYENEETRRKKLVKESSPEHKADILQMESDDEEMAIQKSRQRRKQLIEKLKVSHEEKSEGEKYTTHSNMELNTKNNQNVKSIEQKNSTNQPTDMFSETDNFTSRNGPESIKQDNAQKDNAQLTDNWDNPESYYNVRIGDEINNKQYTIKSVLGQGVFANVVRAQDNKHGNVDVAIKIIRNNDLMYKAGLKEIEMLKEIKKADPENKHHCVRLIQNFMHKSHLCMVLESMHMDMRCILKKYSRHHGINMKALMSYSRQLLVALRLLKKIGIVHADIKPDNILINEKKNLLKLCDFGSASKIDENEVTPYLVSRFYRAPEIILGIPYNHSIDIWSTACTIYEMATGKIMFMGSSNNKMLKCFMDLKGKFSNRLIRKGMFKDQHFNYNFKFLLHKKDEFTGREKLVEINNITITRDLQKDLKKYFKGLTENEEKKLGQLKDILEKMLTLDLNQRITVNDCLKHPFINEELVKFV